MVYYENKYTNRIFDDNALKFAKEVYGDQVDQDIECGYLRKLDAEPDCVTLIRLLYGSSPLYGTQQCRL